MYVCRPTRAKNVAINGGPRNEAKLFIKLTQGLKKHSE